MKILKKGLLFMLALGISCSSVYGDSNNNNSAKKESTEKTKVESKETPEKKKPSSAYELVIVFNEKVLTSTADYMDLPPVIDPMDNIFINFYQITDAFGFEITSDPERSALVATKGDLKYEIIFKKDSSTELYINGKLINSLDSLYTKDGMLTYINYSLLTKELQANVTWSHDKKIMYITSKEFIAKKKADEEAAKNKAAEEKKKEEEGKLKAVPGTGKYSNYLKIINHKFDDLDIYIKIGQKSGSGIQVLKTPENMNQQITSTADGVSKTQSRKDWYAEFEYMSIAFDYLDLRDYYGELFHHWYTRYTNYAALAVASNYYDSLNIVSGLPSGSLRPDSNPAKAELPNNWINVKELEKSNVKFQYKLPENFYSLLNTAFETHINSSSEKIPFNPENDEPCELLLVDMITGDTLYKGVIETNKSLQFNSKFKDEPHFILNKLQMAIIMEDPEAKLGYSFPSNVYLIDGQLIEAGLMKIEDIKE